jgi:hypothetical protein
MTPDDVAAATGGMAGRCEAHQEHPVVRAWQDAAAQALVDRLYGVALAIDGTVWAVDTADADGDDLPLGEVFLLTEDGGRQVTVRVSVELIEGALS